MKPPSNAKNRVKRQFGVILGTAALGLSVYTLAEVEILKAKLQDTNEQVKHIFSQLSNDHTLVRQNAEHLFTIGQALNDVYKWRSYESFKLGELSLTGYIEDFSVNLQNWVDGFLLVALGKQISPRFFRVEDLDKALQHITEEAKKKGLKPVATAISDLAHEEMSVIKQGSVICVLLHLPLGVAEPYQLYKWVDTPLALSDGRTARVHSNLNLIATNDQFSEHAELASSSLQGCTLRKQIYLCPNGLTSKRMDNTCLGSLFIGEVKKAAELCEFTASFETAETVTPLSGTRVLVYSPPNVTTSVYITCQGGLGSKHLLVHGHSSVEVEKHCLLNTGTFVFKPTRTFDIKDIFVSRPLFGMGPAIIGVLFNKTKTPYFDFTPPKDMPFLNSDVYKVHTAVTLPTIGVFLILLTLPLLALYAWRRKRRRDQSGRRHHVLHDQGETTPLPDLPARADSPHTDGVSSRPLKRPPPPGSKSLPGRERGGWLEMQDHIRRIESLGEGDEQMARI